MSRVQKWLLHTDETEDDGEDEKMKVDQLLVDYIMGWSWVL